MNENLKKFILESDFIVHINFWIAIPTYATLVIKKEVIKGYLYYMLELRLSLSKRPLQFTFDENLNIRKHQKSKYNKVENDILAIFEKSIIENNIYSV